MRRRKRGVRLMQSLILHLHFNLMDLQLVYQASLIVTAFEYLAFSQSRFSCAAQLVGVHRSVRHKESLNLIGCFVCIVVYYLGLAMYVRCPTQPLSLLMNLAAWIDDVQRRRVRQPDGIWLNEPAFADGSIAIWVVRAVVMAIPDAVMVAVVIAAARTTITVSRVSATISVIAVINNATG